MLRNMNVNLQIDANICLVKRKSFHSPAECVGKSRAKNFKFKIGTRWVMRLRFAG